jgi:hypothetical protein
MLEPLKLRETCCYRCERGRKRCPICPNGPNGQRSENKINKVEAGVSQEGPPLFQIHRLVEAGR